MSSVSYSPPVTRGEEFKVSLLFGALFPLFLGAALSKRLSALFVRREPPARSAIGEARENMSIAISYALMARGMLRASLGTDPERNACRDHHGRDAPAA